MSKTLLVTLLTLSLFTLLNAQQITVAGKEYGSAENMPLQRSSMLVCDTVFSFPAIDTWPAGLAFDGSCIWSCGSNTSLIYKFDTTGTLIKTLNNPSPASIKSGDLDFEGPYLWLVSEQAGTAYKIDTANGNVITQFALPTNSPSDPNNFGCAYDDGFIWSTEYVDQTLIKFSATTGAIASSFNIGRTVLALAMLNNELYGIGFLPGGDYLLHFDKTNGAVLDSMPWCLDYSLGLCSGINEVWGLSSQFPLGTNRIYKFGSMLLNTPDEISAAGNQFQIYPNPAAFAINITATGNQQHPVNLTLTDLNGKIVHKDTFDHANELTVSVHDLDAGVYLVKVEGASFVEVKRLVVVK